MEVRREISLGAPPLDHRWQDSGHRATEEKSWPATTELLFVWKTEAELDEPAIEIRITRFDAERGGRFVSDLQRQLIERLRQPFDVGFALGLKTPTLLRAPRCHHLPAQGGGERRVQE